MYTYLEVFTLKQGRPVNYLEAFTLMHRKPTTYLEAYVLNQVGLKE